MIHKTLKLDCPTLLNVNIEASWFYVVLLLSSRLLRALVLVVLKSHINKFNNSHTKNRATTIVLLLNFFSNGAIAYSKLVSIPIYCSSKVKKENRKKIYILIGFSLFFY